MQISYVMPGKKRMKGLRGLRGPQEVLKISINPPVENITVAVGKYVESDIEFTGDRLSQKVKDPEMIPVDKTIIDADKELKKEAEKAELQKSWDDEIRYNNSKKEQTNFTTTKEGADPVSLDMTRDEAIAAGIKILDGNTDPNV